MLKKENIEFCLKLFKYYLELLTPDTMKLFGITENEITKNKNGENLEI